MDTLTENNSCIKLYKQSAAASRNCEMRLSTRQAVRRIRSPHVRTCKHRHNCVMVWALELPAGFHKLEPPGRNPARAYWAQAPPWAGVDQLFCVMVWAVVFGEHLFCSPFSWGADSFINGQ